AGAGGTPTGGGGAGAGPERAERRHRGGGAELPRERPVEDRGRLRRHAEPDRGAAVLAGGDRADGGAVPPGRGAGPRRAGAARGVSAGGRRGAAGSGGRRRGDGTAAAGGGAGAEKDGVLKCPFR